MAKLIDARCPKCGTVFPDCWDDSPLPKCEPCQAPTVRVLGARINPFNYGAHPTLQRALDERR